MTIIAMTGNHRFRLWNQENSEFFIWAKCKNVSAPKPMPVKIEEHNCLLFFPYGYWSESWEKNDPSKLIKVIADNCTIDKVQLIAFHFGGASSGDKFSKAVSEKFTQKPPCIPYSINNDDPTGIKQAFEKAKKADISAFADFYELLSKNLGTYQANEIVAQIEDWQLCLASLPFLIEAGSECNEMIRHVISTLTGGTGVRPSDELSVWANNLKNKLKDWDASLKNLDPLKADVDKFKEALEKLREQIAASPKKS